jgi:hypothetical protein
MITCPQSVCKRPKSSPCAVRRSRSNTTSGRSFAAFSRIMLPIRDTSRNRPDTSWPNLRPRSTTFILTHSTSCTYVNLIYTYSLVYSVGKSTQSSYTVVDALSTATDHIAAMKRESNEEGLLAPLRLLECQILRLRCFANGEREFRIIIISPVT